MIENRKSKKEKIKLMKDIYEHIDNKQISDNEKILYLIDKLIKENNKKKNIQTDLDQINNEIKDQEKEINKLNENLNESQQNKDQFESNISKLKETQNTIVDMANDLRDQELKRRDEISKSQKLNFAQVEQKLKSQSEECKRLSIENNMMAEKLRAQEDPLNAKGLDLRTLTKENSNLEGFKTHANKKHVLKEMYKRFDHTKEQIIKLSEYQKALEIDLIESHPEIDLYSKSDVINKNFNSAQKKQEEITKELAIQDDLIEKTKKQRDTMINMCKDLKNKINSKAGQIIISEEFK